MLKLGSDQRRKWLYLCGSHRIYWHLWEFSSVSNQIFTLRWIQTKNSKNISWSFPSWHRPPVRLSSSGHFYFFFFFCIFLSCHSVIGTLSTELPKKKKKQTFTVSTSNLPKKQKTKIKHLHCQQEFEHNAVILTLHRDVNQFREFGWRSRLVNRLTVTNTKTGGCSDYQLHCKKQSHHSSLEFWGGMVSPGKHAYTEWEPPPHRLQSHITAASLSVQKQKKGEQITTVELRRSCSRSTEHRATPREDFRSRHLFIFTSAGGERRETTPSYEHVDQSGGSFSYKNGKTNQLVAGNNSTQTIWLFKRFLNTTVSEVRFLISRRESHVIS